MSSNTTNFLKSFAVLCASMGYLFWYFTQYQSGK